MKINEKNIKQYLPRIKTDYFYNWYKDYLYTYANDIKNEDKGKRLKNEMEQYNSKNIDEFVNSMIESEDEKTCILEFIEAYGYDYFNDICRKYNLIKKIKK